MSAVLPESLIASLGNQPGVSWETGPYTDPETCVFLTLTEPPSVRYVVKPNVRNGLRALTFLQEFNIAEKPIMYDSKYYVVAFVDGESLHEIRQSHERFKYDPQFRQIIATYFAKHICALSFGIAHMDPHFGNTIVTHNGDVTLLDFQDCTIISKRCLPHKSIWRCMDYIEELYCILDTFSEEFGSLHSRLEWKNQNEIRQTEDYMLIFDYLHSIYKIPLDHRSSVVRDSCMGLDFVDNLISIGDFPEDIAEMVKKEATKILQREQ